MMIRCCQSSGSMLRCALDGIQQRAILLLGVLLVIVAASHGDDNQRVVIGSTHHLASNIIDDSSLHPIDLMEEWIDAIKEEKRREDEELTNGNLKGRADKDQEVQREWDLMMDDNDDYLDDEEELNDDKDDEFEEFGSSRERNSRFQHDRKAQSSSACVKTTSGLQAAVKNSNPSSSNRITVCTQRLKLSSTARRRRQLTGTSTDIFQRPTVGSGGGGINFSNRRIYLSCQFSSIRCILDGEGLSRIFYGTNATLYLLGFDFVNATANDKYGSGSALSFMDRSSLTVRDCGFLSNKAKNGSGGAILLHGSSLMFLNSTNFVNNQARFGGALYSMNSTIQTKRSKASSLSWQGNQASNDGGAIYMINGTVGLNQASLNKNKANSGGAGIFIGVKATMKSTDISQNAANGTGGGMVFHNSTIDTMNGTVKGNQATGLAGGISFLNSNVNFVNMLVENNFGNSTGGIAIVSSTANIVLCTFQDNRAVTDGGAATIFGSYVKVNSSRFLNNTSQEPLFGSGCAGCPNFGELYSTGNSTIIFT